jgi:hypothetical protein
MKTTSLKLAALSLMTLVAGVAHAQVSVGASININVPGVYGRVDIGPQPGVAYVPPAVIYPQPVIIAPAPVQQPPLYLYVPEAYTRDWRHHCRAYNACGRPVYFVQDQWVRDRYSQHNPNDHRFDRHDNGRGHGNGHDNGNGNGRGNDHHDDRRDDHRDDRHDDHGHDGDRH